MFLLARAAYNVSLKHQPLVKYLHVLIDIRGTYKIQSPIRSFSRTCTLLSKEDKKKKRNGSSVEENISESKAGKSSSNENEIISVKLQPPKNLSEKPSKFPNKDSIKAFKTPNGAPPKTQGNIGTKAKIRIQPKRVDQSKSSFDRNFLTSSRAMSEFLLTASDLDGLELTKRRSPFEYRSMQVYRRKDVESRAIKKWGSLEKLIQEKVRIAAATQDQQSMFSRKKQLKDVRKELIISQESTRSQMGLASPSGRVVLTALAVNFANVVIKFVAYFETGSHSMFAECLHSLSDTTNQLILAFGMHKSVQKSDECHPYGYAKMGYVASLISGVVVLCFGPGLSFYHGIAGLIDPYPISDFSMAYVILCGSLLSEGVTLIMAVRAAQETAAKLNMSLKNYLFLGREPSLNVVLYEDTAAVVGVAIAGICLGISALTKSSIPDSVGSLLIGCVMGTVASFIIYSNVTALIGRSIPQADLEKINSKLEGDVMIRAIYDVKGVEIGNFMVRYKAEIDFDGRELTRAYLDKQDMNVLLKEVQAIGDVDKLEEFILRHGERIVDMMGSEIDRIELKLREAHPELRHCDLEIL